MTRYKKLFIANGAFLLFQLAGCGTGSVSTSTVEPTPLKISNSTLAPAVNGLPYNVSLNAVGGTPGYKWAVSSGTLPGGLALEPTSGVITGVASASGTASFAVSVSDHSDPVQTTSASVSMTVVSPFALPQATLPDGETGLSYSYALQGTGGAVPYTWQISSGALPPGLSLNVSNGSISGLPTAAGIYPFAVTASDSSSPVQSQTTLLSINVVAAPPTTPTLSLVPANPPTGGVNSAYSFSLLAAGGTAPYRWAISSGALPTGITLNAASGILSGMPTVTGNYSFVIIVTDSSSPTQSQSATVSIAVAPPAFFFPTPSLPAAQVGLSFSYTFRVTGGTTPYQWNISSGALPPGLSLNNSNGSISGLPMAAGLYSFAVTARDSSSPVQSETTLLSINVVAAPPATPTLSLVPANPPNGSVNSAYSFSLLATGGTAPYRWTVSSGVLPSGITLNTAGGVLSGTPTVAGTSAFAITLTDSSNPAQSVTVQESLAIIAPPAPVSNGTTWYVRPDGGTRYSSNMQQGQCNGKADVPYPGKGTNQPCAFNDARYLWQDGSYTVVSDGSTFPAYGWIGSGGDTYLIRGSISSGVSWRVGYPNNADPYDPKASQYWGVAGDPYGSGAPPPLSGTASQHTRILGENYASCHAASAKTQLHGGFGVNAVLNMTGVSYVDVACLDITDFADCGRAAQTNSCNSTLGQIDDYATNGIQWSRASTNDSLTDIHIHGLASAGMVGPTGDGVIMKYVDLIGNAASGWSADLGDGTTGTGSLLVQNFNINWNGCAEEYPMVDALPYQDCTDDNVGGYGDGFGTATVPSSPAWNVTFDQGVVSYNTQDGLDSLHLIGSGSSVTVTRTQAYGNMGQQIKVGGASGTAINNLIVTNCNALRQAIPGTPAGYNSRLSDFCRAADTGMVLKVGPNTRLTYDFNTLYSASATGIEIDCDTTNGPCNANSTVDFRNNIFVGFKNNTDDGYPSGGSGGYSNPVYNGADIDFFGNSGSVFSNNITFHPSEAWTCPANHELSAICGDPGLTDESWHVYGTANMSPTSTSIAIGSGVSIPTIALDYAGVTRKSPPSIGGLEP